MSDNSFGTTFGPSTPGRAEPDLRPDARRARASTRRPARSRPPTPYAVVSPDANGVGTVINDPDPAYDDCSDSNHTVDQRPGRDDRARTSATCSTPQGVTWGWFQGGFTPTTAVRRHRAPTPVCGAHAHQHRRRRGRSTTARTTTPFEYYASTANPHHLPPTSVAEIGHTDQANHKYDLTDFDAALAGGQPAGRQLPEGGRVPGRPRRLLRPDRRAALPGQRDQRDPEVAVLGEHRGRRRLRRLRRLVRPRRLAGR